MCLICSYPTWIITLWQSLLERPIAHDCQDHVLLDQDIIHMLFEGDHIGNISHHFLFCSTIGRFYCNSKNKIEITGFIDKVRCDYQVLIRISCESFYLSRAKNESYQIIQVSKDIGA